MIRAEGNSLEYVRALAHSSVHCDLDLSFGNRRTNTKRVQRGGDAIELSSAVVGNNNAIQIVVNRHLNILGCVY